MTEITSKASRFEMRLTPSQKERLDRAAELDDYIIHWNTKRRQMRLGGHTLEEFWRASTVV